MGIIDKKLELILKEIETRNIISSLKDYDPYLDVKIIVDSRYKPTSVTEFSSKPGQPVTNRQINSKSGLQMLAEELKKYKTTYSCFKKTETNPNDYIVAQLNAFKVRPLASRPYVFEIRDDSPIVPIIKKNNKNKTKNTSANDKDKENSRMEGYHKRPNQAPENINNEKLDD